MKEEKEMQPVSRHHGSAKRPYRLEVSFSEEEWTALVALADKAGEKKIPAFARKLLLGGGTVVATGTPEQIAECEKSYTGQFLKEKLKR